MFLTICVKRWLQGLIWAYEGSGWKGGRRLASALRLLRAKGPAAGHGRKRRPLSNRCRTLACSILRRIQILNRQ